MKQERTHHDELDTKIMRSSAWAVFGYGSTNVLSLITTVILARLLLPADFGLVALTLTLLAVAHLAQESGLGAALIVHKSDLRRAAASALVFSPFVGLAMYSAIFALAPLLADVFHAPRLTNVLRVTALVVPLRGLAIVPQAMLQRAMLFAPVAGIELAGGVAQAGTALGLAVAGAGVWSLVAGQVVAAFAQLGVAWWFTPIRPSPREADWKTLRELARFGRHVGAANIINYGNATAEGVVIGRVLGTHPLGYYTVASRLAQMPVSVLGNILGRGVYAAMAHINDDVAGVKRIWLTNLQRLALLSVPASIGIVFVARPLVEIMLGGTWKAAIVPLQILTLNGIVRTFSATSGEVFQAMQRAQYRVYVEVAHFLLVVPALIVGAKVHGIIGVAAAVVFVNIATGLPILVVLMRMLHVLRARGGRLDRPTGDRLGIDDGCVGAHAAARTSAPACCGPRGACRRGRWPLRRRRRVVRARSRAHDVAEPPWDVCVRLEKARDDQREAALAATLRGGALERRSVAVVFACRQLVDRVESRMHRRHGRCRGRQPLGIDEQAQPALDDIGAPQFGCTIAALAVLVQRGEQFRRVEITAARKELRAERPLEILVEHAFSQPDRLVRREPLFPCAVDDL